jgi:hypothetical protein
MLEMFIELEDHRLSQFIRKDFSFLLDLNMKIFEKYLESCFFKHISMRTTKTVRWVFEEDEAFVDFHTSYLGEEFYQKLLNYR